MCVVRAFATFALVAGSILHQELILIAAQRTTEATEKFTVTTEIPERNSNLTVTERTNNGKTYFIQLKKILTSNGENGRDEDNDKQYVKINHYKNTQDGDGFKELKEVQEEEFIRKKYHDLFSADIAENIKEATLEDVKRLERKRNPNRIDDEWVINSNRSIYDLPNITQEIYEAMLENNKHNSIVNASTVKFFFEKNTNHSSNIVRFNIESLVNSSDIIVDAELHVYRLPRENNSTVKINASENVVRLYQMTEDLNENEENSTRKPSSAPDIHKLANVIYISSNYEGWQVFKVKTVVDNWRNGDDNLGFLISTVDAHDKEDAVEFAHRERNGGKYQPTLVVYLDRQVAPNRKSMVRRVRKPFRPMRRGDALPANPCRRHVWYLSFHELGWNNFIIAPGGFMAYRCDGSCQSPSGGSFSNHGKLLSIMEGRAGNALMPCCVPSSYKSILIMFYDKENNVVIKEYEDMVVNSCGCR